MLVRSGGKRKQEARQESATESLEAKAPASITPANSGAQRAKGEAEQSAAPARATRPVTAADLLVREDKPLVPINEATGRWVTWTFRHPDLDGSGYTGPVYVTKLNKYLSAERGYVRVEKAEERDALAAMGWMLWHTEVPDARPVRVSGTV